MPAKIKVLVVDDSALVREIITQGLSADASIEVVGGAADPYEARDMIVALRPDVITLDVEMPRMDGIEFLRRLMPQYPLPVVMVSSLTEKGCAITLDALHAGAVDFVAKPTTQSSHGAAAMIEELREKVLAAATVNVKNLAGRPLPPSPIFKSPPSYKASAPRPGFVVAIGASTGGTEAIHAILSNLPAEFPAILVVQHMPPGFTKLFANRLDSCCAIRVKEAVDGDRLLQGTAFVAPGGFQTRLVHDGAGHAIRVVDEPTVSGHRPSVDVLFHSVARNFGRDAFGVILTGMGHDGADGLLAMRKAGAKTLAQDEATSIVYGMPKSAWERHAAAMQAPLHAIAKILVEACSNHRKARST